MNNKLLYIVGGVVVVGIIIAFMVYKPSGTQAPSGEMMSGTSDDHMTLKGLISKGGSQKCSFTNNYDTVQSNGVVYVTQGKMRGDFTTTVSGKTTASHMIVDNNTSYIWTDDMKQGYKMSFAEMNGDMTAQNSAAFDVNKELNYSCGTWSGDSSVFVLPSTITFADMNAMMQGMGGSMGAGANGSAEMKAGQCSACDSAPEPSRSQCRAAMGCK